MTFSFRIFIWLNIILILTVSIASLGNLYLLKREIRFSKFDTNSLNSSILTVLKSGIKQYRDKQMLYCHLNFHKKLDNISAQVEVLKCKDYYVDCVNVISYEISDACSGKPRNPWFSSVHVTKNDNMSKACQGEVNFDNVTLSADQFGMFFSFPNEKWWELYWKLRVNLYTKEQIRFFHENLEFYFIQYRSRN